MTQKIQRNAPCPCGSGKKYKRCCMIHARDQMLASANRRDGVLHALDWVRTHYQEQTDAWVNDVWLTDMSEQQRQGIATADAVIRSIHDMNLLEYLVAEGEYSELDGEKKPLQLILNAGDVALDEEQRAYLQQLSEQALRLYQVTDCVPGKSFSVRDKLQMNSEDIVIADTYGSRMLDVNDVVGLRLMETTTGWETSGAIYHVPDDYVAELEQQMQDSNAASSTLIRYWLGLVAEHV